MQGMPFHKTCAVSIQARSRSNSLSASGSLPGSKGSSPTQKGSCPVCQKPTMLRDQKVVVAGSVYHKQCYDQSTWNKSNAAVLNALERCSECNEPVLATDSQIVVRGAAQVKGPVSVEMCWATFFFLNIRFFSASIVLRSQAQTRSCC